MRLTAYQRQQTAAALRRSQPAEYSECDLATTRDRERQLIAEAERIAERAHRMRLLDHAAWRASVRERLK